MYYSAAWKHNEPGTQNLSTRHTKLRCVPPGKKRTTRLHGENENDTFVRNAGKHVQDDTASQPEMFL
jgi:hypothetical protein